MEEADNNVLNQAFLYKGGEGLFVMCVCESELKDEDSVGEKVGMRGWLFQDAARLEKRGCGWIEADGKQLGYKWGRLNDRGGGVWEAQG